ncbi:DUF2141 domain-containing protein [uncultured Sphingomonas sp.]|uniref:DUF2141 domain-containing protein n=1 Tax=uncultured Sphingomonas sp. TaxID=158754 RepID=UPI0035CB9ADF
MRHLTIAALTIAALSTATATAAETIGEDAPLCETGRGPAIEVNVQGLKDRAGELWLELYPATPGDYLAPDQDLVAQGKIFRRARSRVPVSGNVAICVRVPRPGRYALMLRHNRVGRDKFSFWSDGAGVPGGRSLGRSKPTLEQAAVEAGPGVTTVNIKVQYLRGFGFSPLN